MLLFLSIPLHPSLSPCQYQLSSSEGLTGETPIASSDKTSFGHSEGGQCQTAHYSHRNVSLQRDAIWFNAATSCGKHSTRFHKDLYITITITITRAFGPIMKVLHNNRKPITDDRWRNQIRIFRHKMQTNVNIMNMKYTGNTISNRNNNNNNNNNTHYLCAQWTATRTIVDRSQCRDG
jgi:hypothetical protein